MRSWLAPITVPLTLTLTAVVMACGLLFGGSVVAGASDLRIDLFGYACTSLANVFTVAYTMSVFVVVVCCCCCSGKRSTKEQLGWGTLAGRFFFGLGDETWTRYAGLRFFFKKNSFLVFSFLLILLSFGFRHQSFGFFVQGLGQRPKFPLLPLP